MKGSFEGLYTFLEVAEIYGIDDSCLRKQVARDKFVIGEEVKKMGRTWIITEQAMIKSFLRRALSFLRTYCRQPYSKGLWRCRLLIAHLQSR